MSLYVKQGAGLDGPLISSSAGVLLLSCQTL